MPMGEFNPTSRSPSLRGDLDVVSAMSSMKILVEDTTNPLVIEKQKLQRLRWKLKSAQNKVARLESFIARRGVFPIHSATSSGLRGTVGYHEGSDDDWEPSSPSTDSSDEDYEYADSEPEYRTSEDDYDGLDHSDLSSADSKLSVIDRVVETNLSDSTKEELKEYVKLLLQKIDDLQGRIKNLKRRLKDYQHGDSGDELGNLRSKLGPRAHFRLDSNDDGCGEYPTVGVGNEAKKRQPLEVDGGFVYREISNDIMKLSGEAKTLFELDPNFGQDPIVHPQIPPLVKGTLSRKFQNVNETAEEHANNDEDGCSNRVYYSAQYQQEDLDFIKITTLPSTGLEKPYHNGTSKGDNYYLGLFDRIVQNFNIWVAKYFEPDQGSINIDTPEFNTALKGLIAHTDFFNIRDFMPGQIQVEDEATKMARCNKRLALYRAVLFAIISREIFEPWIVALDKDVIDMICQEQQLRKEDRFTDVGISKRANYFLSCIRQSLPSCTYYELSYRHCFVLFQRIKAIFEPLFAYTKQPNPSLETQTTCERELFLMLSECYALQIMFQSEKDVMYKVTFARPGEEFNETYMLDVTDYFAQAPEKIDTRSLPNPATVAIGQSKKMVDCSVSMGLYRRGRVLGTTDTRHGGGGGGGIGGVLPALVDGRSTVQAGPLLLNNVTTKDERALSRPFLVPESLC